MMVTLAVGGMFFLAWLGLAGRPSNEFALSNEFDLSKHSVPLDQIMLGGPGKDGIPALFNPLFIHATDAAFLTAEDRVLGLSLGQEAKAYPIKILNWHEIVNDTVGGKPVVVTYCPLCGTGIGFDALVGEQRHTFGVSGCSIKAICSCTTIKRKVSGHRSP